MMNGLKIKGLVFCLVLCLSILALLPFISAQQNFEYDEAVTRVNVTNALPEVLEVNIDQDIVLVAGDFKTVYCNATIRDWNGWEDITSVNGTFYHSSSHSGAEDDGNVHYTNSSCEIYDNDGEYIAYSSCTFDVIHYANSGEWFCNVSAQDSWGFNGSLENVTDINELYALNVTDTVDYGDVAVMSYSLDVPALIANIGNMDINVSVLGYGVEEGDGLGLVCERGDDIGVEHQRFSSSSSVDWEDKSPLSESNQDMGFTIPQATDETAPSIWEVYWQLYVPPNPQGECTGTLRFTATPSA